VKERVPGCNLAIFAKWKPGLTLIVRMASWTMRSLLERQGTEIMEQSALVVGCTALLPAIELELVG
jgi:hypothetical protein